MKFELDKNEIEKYKSDFEKKFPSYENLVEVSAKSYSYNMKLIDLLKSTIYQRDNYKEQVDLYVKIVDVYKKIYEEGFFEIKSIFVEYIEDIESQSEEIAKKKSELFELVRKKGAEANKTKAATNREFILETNSDLLRSPEWARKTLDERAKYIANACIKNRKNQNNGKPYSESYIKKLITGK